MSIKILPYRIGSESAKALAQSLNLKRIIPDGRYIPNSRTVVLNWGNSHPHFTTDKIINHPSAVAIAKDKLKTFIKLEQNNIPTVPFTTDKNKATEWLRDGRKVVCRLILDGNSGRGIEVIRPEDEREIPNAPLYTKYVKKDMEYRIHVFGNEIIDMAEKRKRAGADEVEDGHDPLIRNYENGWVFCRDGCNPPDIVKNVAFNAVIALGLDFGAVDIILSKGRAYVLEVNTAPGLQGTTLERYSHAIRSTLRNYF